MTDLNEMNASELRIGNYIWNPIMKEIKKVDHLDIRDMVEGRLIKEYIPIPLSQEWFINFGFEKTYDNQYWTDNAGFHIENNEKCYMYAYADDSVLLGQKILYVHQLQNLFFALIGQELQLK